MEENHKSQLSAYAMPFVIFMAGLALAEAVRNFGKSSEILVLREPEYWVYPLQTILCGVALLWFWRRYHFGKGIYPLAATAAGLLALILWLAPQFLSHAPRTNGFDPTVFSETPTLYWFTVIARFVRLVVIVPLVEEIFWRGFLMRYLISEDFEKIALGTFCSRAFFSVAGLFMLVHGISDWPAAFATGLIYNGLLVKTKSLTACVIAHAVTNLGLGLYIMATHQWGFW